MMRISFLALMLAPSLSTAETTLSPEAFEAEVQGKTYLYSQNGEVYGAEIYRPGRRVDWSFLDNQCSAGFWYPDGDEICFVYEDLPSPQCWRFTLDGDDLIADLPETADSTTRYRASRSPHPLICPGPDVGA